MKQTRIHNFFKVVGNSQSCCKEGAACTCPLLKSKSRRKTTMLKSPPCPKIEQPPEQSPKHHEELLGDDYDAEKLKQFKKKFGAKRRLPAPIYSDEELEDEPHDKRKALLNITLNIPVKSPKGNSKKSSLDWKNPYVDLSKAQISPQKSQTNSVKSTQKGSENDQNSTLDFSSCSLLNATQSSTQPSQSQGKHAKNTINYGIVTKMIDLCVNIEQSKNCLRLFTKEELNTLNAFLGMDKKYQYFCMKLFMWKLDWYNLFKMVTKLKLDMQECEIREMFLFLKDKHFVDTEYMNEENTYVLLNMLELRHLKEICTSLHIRPITGCTKDGLVTKLLKFANSQTTLSTKKTSKQLLRDQIEEKKGACLRISQCFYNCLYKVFLLNTISSSEFVVPQDYFSRADFLGIQFLQLPIEDYNLFASVDEFEKYAEAAKLRTDFDTALERKEVDRCLEICKVAYVKLTLLCAEGPEWDKTRPRFLERFTSISQYASILTSGSKKLSAKNCHHDIKTWLEFLLSQDYCRHKRGFWYNQLLLIFMKYFKDYKGAAELFIKCFEESEADLSVIQKQDLVARGKMLLKPHYKLPQMLRDKVALQFPATICESDFPTITITQKTMRGNESGHKRKYVHELQNGEKVYMSVEDTALRHYLKKGYSKGEHCEGRLIVSSFILLFFDVIYEARIQGTFVTKTQNAPLDMYTEYFYKNRQFLIKQRLKDIESGWSENQIKDILVSNYEQYSDVYLLHKVSAYCNDPEMLFDLLMCIGRAGVAAIYQRLSINFKDFHSGFPDLIVWNTEQKICKFVEVKGEGDSLSTKQKFWIKALLESGVQAEICHVHSIGSKVKPKRPST